jgi:hypothetical protein
MVDLERLKLRARCAYELGRVRSAARIALYLAPPAALCLYLSPDRTRCACLIAALLAATVALRWRDRRGTESVRIGLIAGSFPLAAALLLATDPRCERLLCIGVSALIAAGAGVWVGLRQRDPGRRGGGPLVACGIAILAASVGCLPLGVLGILGVVAGLVVGSSLGSLARPSTSRS